ncbi:hypothetical protein [Sphingomonas psychrotolerans]|uniref:Uncharacterized protein n=1 Tax=Sphingomonas psychrotolerans TaxID=1327635 RepID=A0A2K8MCN4_9SPHN|nr:hypothetical protein [Sphingomonas psychrotolerans]ATY31623.1 hypothetical protein CVN68_06260 [Sphingomonas psychrotolerans]
MHRLALFASLAWLSLTSAAPGDPATQVMRVDPLTVQDDDFARHRDPAEWRGLAVSRIEFREERAAWRLWRIENVRHRRGPLWFVPHDNENAGFEAGLEAVRRYGGTLIAVDAGIADDGARMNRAVDYGRPVDPNRNFDSALPGYARRILADLRPGMPIIALHTNGRGFDTGESRCNQSDPPGQGVISIRYCDDVLTPSPSQGRAWPWDDDDTVAFATWRTKDSPTAAFCRNQMIAADFNVVQERVVASDRSLSNYAVLHGLHYLNFETLDRGDGADGLAEGRKRLVHIIDRALAMCAPKVRPVAR